jgi:hypothetical protein
MNQRECDELELTYIEHDHMCEVMRVIDRGAHCGDCCHTRSGIGPTEADWKKKAERNEHYNIKCGDCGLELEVVWKKREECFEWWCYQVQWPF